MKARSAKARSKLGLQTVREPVTDHGPIAATFDARSRAHLDRSRLQLATSTNVARRESSGNRDRQGKLGETAKSGRSVAVQQLLLETYDPVV